MLDFTIEKYEKLCHTIKKSNYKVITINEYLSAKEINSPLIIFRHDVDRKVGRVLRMASLESKYGISATYYFRKINKVFVPGIIKAVNDLGHDIGYHYEVVDKSRGDLALAKKIFFEELAKFREIASIQTCVMHGNAISKWDNREIWNISKIEDFDLVGEGYISIDFKKVYYFTDTGRRWDGGRYNIKDRMDNSISDDLKVRNTDDLISLINKGELPVLYINTHPKKWSGTKIEWFFEQADVTIRNQIKRFYPSKYRWRKN